MSEVITLKPKLIDRQFPRIRDEALKIMKNPLDSWDTELREELVSCEENDREIEELTPRALGWLLKHGLLPT